MVAYLQSENTITVLGWVNGTTDEMIDQALELAADLDISIPNNSSVCLARSGDLIPAVEDRDETLRPGWHKKRRGA